MSLKLTPLAAALGTAVLCASLHARPLQVELKNVLEAHPLIKAGRLSVGAAQDRLEAASSNIKPKIIVNSDAGLEAISSTSFKPDADLALGNSGVITPATTSDLVRRKFGLTLEQPLYNGGRTQSSIDIASSDLSMQELNGQAVVQDVLLEAITAYLQVSRFQTLIELTRLNEDTTKTQLELESKRMEGGGGVAVDVMQARTRLQIVKERRVFYEQALRDAMATYEQNFGSAPDLSRMQEVGIYQAGLPKDLSTALNEGLAASPRVKAAGVQVRKAQDQITSVKSAWMPTVDLVAATNHDNNAAAVARRNDYSLLFRLNWNYSLGGETKHRVAAAVKEKDELIERETATKNKARESIRIAWNQVVNGRERIDLLDNAASISRDVMVNRKRLRDAGKETALSALDAEVEYFGVLANKVNAIYDTRLGSYRLLAAVGKLTPDDLGIRSTFKLPVSPLKINLEAIAGPGAK